MNMSTPSEIELARTRFPVGPKIAEGDLADLHSSTLKGEPVVLKIGRDIRDNDLLDNEVNVLHGYLYPPHQKDEKFYRYLPKLLSSGHLPDGRSVTVWPFMDGYFSMAQVISAFPKGIDFRDMVWMYKRTLSGLGFIHEMGVIHGAIIPAHVLVHPTGHGAKIIDWSYALNFAAVLADAEAKKKAAEEAEAAKLAAAIAPPPDPDPYAGMLSPLDPYGYNPDPLRPRAPKKKAASKAADPAKNTLSVWALLRQNNFDDDPAPVVLGTAAVKVPPPDPNKMYVRAMSVDYEKFYAPEILRKETPSPATDIYMAAKCAVALCGGDVETGVLPDNIMTTDPEGLEAPRVRMAVQAFLQSSLLTDPRKRPQDAWDVHEAFDKLLQGLVGPNKYRPFSMPGAQP